MNTAKPKHGALNMVLCLVFGLLCTGAFGQHSAHRIVFQKTVDDTLTDQLDSFELNITKSATGTTFEYLGARKTETMEVSHKAPFKVAYWVNGVRSQKLQIMISSDVVLTDPELGELHAISMQKTTEGETQKDEIKGLFSFQYGNIYLVKTTKRFGEILYAFDQLKFSDRAKQRWFSLE